MRHGYLPGILAGACLLLTGCPPEPVEPNLNDAIDVVGADWVKRPPAKNTGGPTVVPPKVTSNSSVSFDVEVAAVAAGHTVNNVAKLAIAMDGLGGHYLFDVGLDNRTPTGSILVTVVQEQPVMPEVKSAFKLQVVAVDAAGRGGDIVDVDAAFFAASAGEDGMAGVGETVVLNATFTGATGTPDVTWSQVSGPTTDIADPSAASTTFVPSTVGTYVMKLEAVDPTGVVDVDLLSILVVDEFTVDAGESGVVQVGETVQLRGLAAGGVGQATFEWTQVSGPPVVIEDPTSRVASFVAPETGEYEFELAATDEMMGTVDDRVIYLAVDGLTALASAPAEPQQPGATVLLQGQAAGGLYPYAFRWTQIGDPEVDIEDPTNQTAIVTLNTAGEYTFVLRVEDSTATTDTDSVTISVACVEDSDCDDDKFCNGTETCTIPEGETEGTCNEGTNPCTPDQICDEEDDECKDPGCPPDVNCDDGNACTTDTYDLETCECSHDPLVCDDDQDCTEDTCDPNSGCVFTDTCPEGTRCVGDECIPIPDECIFSDDFEDGLGDWFADNGIWEVGVPTSGPEEAYSSAQLAATVLDGNYPQTDSRLVSPSILLPEINAGDEIHLRFWHWFSFGPGDWGEVHIREQTAPGEWTEWTSLEDYRGSSGVFTHALVDLSAHAGKAVQIGFWLAETGCCVGLGWYVDDVTVCQKTTAEFPSSGFFEDFEDGLGDWFADNGIWEVGVPTSGPEEAYSGVQLAATVLAGNYPQTDSRLVSPSINVPAIEAGDQIRLRFWHWFSFGPGDWGEVHIREQTAPGEWTEWTSLEDYRGSSGVFTHALVDLSAHAGRKVQIGFWLAETGCCVGLGWYVDDVTIEVP